MSAQQLLEIGAWRAPIFMVDRIADFTPGAKGSITVAKHVTYNEPYIAGHFTDNPVMPGVMIAEIFGQGSEYFSFISEVCEEFEQKTGRNFRRFDDVAELVRSPEGRRAMLEKRGQAVGFLAAQDLKFKKVVYPGDTIYAECRLAFADAQGFHHYNVEARVGRHVVTEGTIINFRTSREKIAGSMATGLTR